MTDPTDECRAAFEAWIRPLTRTEFLSRRRDGSYFWAKADERWRGWREAWNRRPEPEPAEADLHGKLSEAWSALRAVLGPNPSPDPGESLSDFIRRAVPEPEPAEDAEDPVRRLGEAVLRSEVVQGWSKATKSMCFPLDIWDDAVAAQRGETK